MSPAATYGSGGSHSDVGTKTPLVPAVVTLIATYTGSILLPPTGADTRLTLAQLALCGGIHIYSASCKIA